MVVSEEELKQRINKAIAERVTACECSKSGYCQRHGINKGPRFFELCCTNAEYFQAWENCKGPGQPVNCEEYKGLSEEEAGAKYELEQAYELPSEGFGDTLAKAIHATGLDKLKEKVTGKSGCGGCNRRRKWLNESLPYGSHKKKK